MQTVLLVVHLLVVLALVGVVLLQRSEGGGLGLGSGGGGGVQGFMSGRGQANALTRATAILAAAFFILSIALSVLAGQNRAPRSIIDGGTRPAGSSAPQAPAGGNLLDQLHQIDGQAPGTPAPAGAQPPRPQAPAQ
ncbi:MAG: preprotein translocase subunit SecG [Bosea sp. (in: a-proteobacteria)]